MYRYRLVFFSIYKYMDTCRRIYILWQKSPAFTYKIAPAHLSKNWLIRTLVLCCCIYEHISIYIKYIGIIYMQFNIYVCHKICTHIFTHTRVFSTRWQRLIGCIILGARCRGAECWRFCTPSGSILMARGSVGAELLGAARQAIVRKRAL